MPTGEIGGDEDRPADRGDVRDGGGPADDLGEDLLRLVAETRTEDAIKARVRERNLRTAASIDASLIGVLLDCAERQAALAFRTTAGRTTHGRILIIARDAIAIDPPSGALTYIRLDALLWARRLPGAGHGPEPDATGDRPAPRDTTFSALVAGLAPNRPTVALAVAGEPALLHGELRGAGADVLTVRLDGDPPLTTYVATNRVAELIVVAP